jgi:Arc/MetJ-type ribon-helix-helix transcriptional regulator
MTISLSPETQELLEAKLKTGKYHSPDELVKAALKALDYTEIDDETLDDIDRAEDQIDRGETVDWKEIREQVRARLSGT